LNIKQLLNQKVKQYNRPEFIANDPIAIPHLFTQPADIEIMGFFAAVFSWGQRITIINKCKDLIERMDGAPHDFIINHKQSDLKKMIGFKHRTFNDSDLLYFMNFLQDWYRRNSSLELAFSQGMYKKDKTIERGLNHFRTLFFSLPHVPNRTYKHIASPELHSACKRLNMFLRWMVRTDTKGVDFGIWKTISPAQLVCPLDVHVQRVAMQLGLLQRKQSDWQAAIELTENLKLLDASDPVKFDFALFGLGVMQEM
jgi:uncharacterized protein (TIGR02757 family)